MQGENLQILLNNSIASSILKFIFDTLKIKFSVEHHSQNKFLKFKNKIVKYMLKLLFNTSIQIIQQQSKLFNT